MTAIHLTEMGSEFPNPVGNALNRILSPVEEVVWKIGDGIKKNARAIFKFRQVVAENEEYRKQIDKLKSDNLMLKEQVLAALRYEELSKPFNSPTLDKYNKTGATIINRNPSAWYQTIKVNKGSKDGVKNNYPVVANLGLVGKVVAVTPTTADILMITDTEGKVGAMVRDNQGKPIFGVLSGTFERDNRLQSWGTLEITFRQEDEVNVGDLVFTSGLGGVYPKGIPIGVVASIKIDSSGIQKIAAVDPIVNFDTLEEVYIINILEES
ncbi:MAG: rod shape-determining protein MreC [Peptococcaceae bacterium]|nr:rod shape-determining protein MreC [Peptococcaceae bacterium]